MTSNIKAIQKTNHQAHLWINELMATYNFTDENKAFVVLKATLKALRDRILPGEVVQLGSQLPALIRGFYYEGWDPNARPNKEKTIQDFLSTVHHYLAGHDDIDLNVAVPEVLKLIFDKIDEGEAHDVKMNLPKDIQELCP